MAANKKIVVFPAQAINKPAPVKKPKTKNKSKSKN